MYTLKKTSNDGKQYFYTSKEWRRLVEYLKAERMQGEGFIRCSVCGEPIYKSYKLIAHHKQHLTEDNVNDISVSLNPDNIVFVCHECHNKEHNRSGAYKKREVHLVFGPPYAGKSDFIKKRFIAGDIIIDVDALFECLSMQNRSVHPVNILRNVLDVRAFLIDEIKTRRGGWNNAWIVGTYPSKSEREKLIRDCAIRPECVHFIDATLEECKARAREEGVDGFDEIIEKYFNKRC